MATQYLIPYYSSSIYHSELSILFNITLDFTICSLPEQIVFDKGLCSRLKGKFFMDFIVKCGSRDEQKGKI